MTKTGIPALLVLLLAGAATLWPDNWQELPPGASPDARRHHAMVTLVNDIFLYGGKGTGGALLDDVWQFRPDEAWEEQQTSGPKPEARAYHSAASLNGKMYISGGLDQEGNDLRDFWAYDPADGTWTRIASAAPPGAGYFTSMVVLQNLLYFFGGEFGEGFFKKDLWSYDPATGEWQEKKPAPFDYTSQKGVAYNDQMYVLTETGEWWNYDPAGDTWQKDDSPNAPPHLFNPGVVQQGSGVLVFGGEDAQGNALGETWKYNFNTMTWAQKSDMLVPLKDFTTTGATGVAPHLTVI